MAERRESYNPLLKSFPDSDKINAVSEGAEVLYLRLLAQSDDAGRYYGDAKWVRAKLFTARMVSGVLTEEEVERRLSELATVGLIRRYEVAGAAYLELLNVYKRLRNDVKAQVIFPEPLTDCVPCTGRTRNGDVTLEAATEPATEPEPTQLLPSEACSPLPQTAAAEPTEFVFPTTGKGAKDWTLSKAKFAEYVEAYPTLDVTMVLRKARQWCRDNPGNRKTAGGMLAFLTGWFNREVNQRRSHNERSTTKHNSGRSGEARERSL